MVEVVDFSSFVSTNFNYKCNLCQDTGLVRRDNHRGVTRICQCDFGKEILQQINQQKIKCPECGNSGLVVNQYLDTIIKYFCQCVHGQKLLQETREHPRNCPICCGRETYESSPLFEDSIPCPHLD